MAKKIQLKQLTKDVQIGLNKDTGIVIMVITINGKRQRILFKAQVWTDNDEIILWDDNDVLTEA